MKKFMSIVLVLILLMANVAVSFAEDTDNIRNHSWQLGHILTGADNDNYHVFCTYFANNVKEMSGGKMQVEVLPNAQLGGERDMVEGCGWEPSISRSHKRQRQRVLTHSLHQRPALYLS